MDLFDLSGRVAVVTGGNGGLGLGMARGLVKAGANVAIWARDEAKKAKALLELRSYGTAEAITLICDVAEESQIEAAMKKTLESFGRVDACFANAGRAGQGAAIPDLTREGWDEVMAVNTRGPRSHTNM